MKVPKHMRGEKGFSEQMANAINREQASKVIHKMSSSNKKMHPPRAKQGYTPQRSGVDTSTL